MGKKASVRISQPHVEQLHKYLEQALDELLHLHAEAANPETEGLRKRIEEVDYLVRTARQSLPAKQLELPF